MGIAPCSFTKTAGTHIITLTRTGYVTRSYTIKVDSEEKDISYAFADLESSTGNTDLEDVWDQVLGIPTT